MKEIITALLANENFAGKAKSVRKGELDHPVQIAQAMNVRSGPWTRIYLVRGGELLELTGKQSPKSEGKPGDVMLAVYISDKAVTVNVYQGLDFPQREEIVWEIDL